MSKKRPAAVAPASEPTAPPVVFPFVPGLRTALWLFLAVLTVSYAVLVLAGETLPRLLVTLLSALLVAAGFTIATIFILGVRPAVVIGPRPKLAHVVIGTVAGIALYYPALWIIFVVNSLLNTLIGFLISSDPGGVTVSRLALIGQNGVLVPLCYALLFFGLIQRSAERNGRLTGVMITATLFGLFALVSTPYYLSAVPAHFLVGFVAALASYYTRSMWGGTAVLIGYSVVRPVTEFTVMGRNIAIFLQSQGFSPSEVLFGGRWLLVVIGGMFVAFVCLQVLRVSTEGAAPAADSGERAPRGRLWWLPVVLTALLVVLIVVVEIQGRAFNPSPTASSIFTVSPDAGQ